MVWLVLRRKFLLYSHRILLLLFFLDIIYIWLWYSLSQQLLYESIEEIVLLVKNYCLLHQITHCCQLEWYDWCWGGGSYIIPSVYIIPGLSQTNQRMILPVLAIALWIYFIVVTTINNHSPIIVNAVLLPNKNEHIFL